MGILLKRLTARCLPSKEASARMTWDVCQEDPSGTEPESLCEDLDCPHAPPSHEDTAWVVQHELHHLRGGSPGPPADIPHPSPTGSGAWAMLVPQGLLPALPGPLLHFTTRREGLFFPLYTAGGAGLTLPRQISNRGGSNPDHPSPGARFPEASLSLAIR